VPSRRLDARARSFYVDWEQAAHDIAAALRHEAGQNPHDRALQDLIGLLTVSPVSVRGGWPGAGWQDGAGSSGMT